MVEVRSDYYNHSDSIDSAWVVDDLYQNCWSRTPAIPVRWFLASCSNETLTWFLASNKRHYIGNVVFTCSHCLSEDSSSGP